MILTESQAREHLESRNNFLNTIPNSGNSVVKEIKNGKVICHEGGGKVVALGPIMKRIVVATAIDVGAKKTAESFNLSRQAVTNLTNGKSTDGTKPDVEIKEFVEKHRMSAAELALRKTMEAFNLMTGDKMSKASARDLASIAKDSAVVFDKLAGKSDNGGASVKVMIYAPVARDIKEYDVIEVESK